jgi:hypothetical protein
MLREMPLIPQGSLTRAFRVAASPTDGAVLRRLRSHSAISDGLAHPLRDPRGRIRGSVHLYCALNRDAVYQARLGHWDEAKALAKEAARLEQRTDTAELAAEIAKSMHRPSVAELASATQASSTSTKMRTTIERLTADIEKVRHRDHNGCHSQKLGQVVRIQDDMAHIELTGATLTSVPLKLLTAKSLGHVGAWVSMDWQLIEGEALINVEPAVETEGDPERYPFLPLSRETHPDAGAALEGMEPVVVPNIPAVIHGR